MHDDSTSQQAVDFLLGLVENKIARRVRRRIGLSRPDRSPEAQRRLLSRWTWPPVPASMLLWALEEDDSELNTVVWRHLPANDGIRRAIVRGVPFGPGRTEPVPVAPTLRGQEPPVPESFTRLGLVGALRTVASMEQGRAAASMVVERPDWQEVADADGERPLPGYARWALSVRPDCPPALRAGFGTHRKFTHRVRQAGILSGPAEYATEHGPAARALGLLSLGHTLFPARLAAAQDALRPLVRDHLGESEEAWAVLAQLMPTFHGTAPELVVTAGAIA
ncbi:hypothetical protein FNH09_19915 [Streptomyces adustus]|uniref:Uncharacterized protein n=1 Tax=Streptomyces adustus TaxID=1609272 RepID=A0A5N8VH80_9ACTN|nr:hypothetical protein [Streptomyces adustus]MPY33444.1 hypothetical protein [Streptomyces adustus]